MEYFTAPLPVTPGITRRHAETAAVTELLARVMPPGVRLGHGAAGEPLLEGSAFHISISHSRSRVAVALRREGPVGIDIEDDPRRCGRVIGRVTHPDEKPGDLSPIERWTIKEAVFKAALLPGLTIGEIVVGADGTAVARGRRFAWEIPEPGIAIAYPAADAGANIKRPTT